MITLKKITTTKALLLLSLLIGLFIIYPNIAQIPWDMPEVVQKVNSDDNILFPEKIQSNYYYFKNLIEYWCFFTFRYLFFSLTIWCLLILNVRKIKNAIFIKRFVISIIITLFAYGLYILISLSIGKHIDCFTIHLLFQFVVAGTLCVLTGYAIALYSTQREKEQEIERLKSEMLQSRCDALKNQINPHFFFNSLNSLTYLIRGDNKEQTLEYVNELSNVFRFILQSDKKEIVVLDEELNFLKSFRYLMEVRFANKLTFHIDVEESAKKMKLPVLSLLPLIDNIVVHNAIDSEHKMEISVVSKKTVSGITELIVSNPVFPKLEKSITNGTGLTNLRIRFKLLMHKDIIINDNEQTFTIILPLT